jgi:hypothetical protein
MMNGIEAFRDGARFRGRETKPVNADTNAGGGFCETRQFSAFSVRFIASAPATAAG